MFLHLDYLDSCSTKLRHYINDFRYKNLVDINLLTDYIKGNNAGMGDQHTDASTVNLPDPSIPKRAFPLPPSMFLLF